MRIAPKSADYGYYVDNYKKNGESGVKDTIDNPANGVLSEMLDYFTPGTSWDNETIDNVTDNNSHETGDTSSAVMKLYIINLKLAFYPKSEYIKNIRFRIIFLCLRRL